MREAMRREDSRVIGCGAATARRDGFRRFLFPKDQNLHHGEAEAEEEGGVVLPSLAE